MIVWTPVMAPLVVDDFAADLHGGNEILVWIGSGVDVVCVGGTKPGDVDGYRLIPGHGEVRCIGRLGVEAECAKLT